jgi:photosystem II stability/assembly factor-like uncharacterized protein
VDASHGFVLDVGGKALSTADAGSSWSLLDIGTTVKPNAIYAIDTSKLLLFGPEGVRRSDDAGQTFTSVDSKAGRTAELNDYDRTDGPTLYAYGQQALIVSSDGGVTWKNVKKPVLNPDYRKVDFVTAVKGYALMTDGRVFRTSSGGKKWAELKSVGNSTAYDISFGDASTGFLSVHAFGNPATQAFGWVMRTSDSGATWRPQLISPSPVASRGIATPAAATAFSLGGPSDLFYTSTGGDQGAATAVTIKAAKKVVTKTRSVKITGSLVPTVAGAQVQISARNPKNNKWRIVGVATVSSAGTFTTSYRVTRTSQLVAQWRGDADHNGDGSPAITITKKTPPKKKR